MTAWWKPLLGIVLLVPVAAFVVGSLVSTSSDEPGPRDTIVVEPADDAASDDPGTQPRRDRPSDRPGDDDRDDRGDDGDDVGVQGDGDERVPPDLRRPTAPTGDDDDDDGGGDDDDDDDGGDDDDDDDGDDD